MVGSVSNKPLPSAPLTDVKALRGPEAERAVGKGQLNTAVLPEPAARFDSTAAPDATAGAKPDADVAWDSAARNAGKASGTPIALQAKFDDKDVKTEPQFLVLPAERGTPGFDKARALQEFAEQTEGMKAVNSSGSGGVLILEVTPEGKAAFDAKVTELGGIDASPLSAMTAARARPVTPDDLPAALKEGSQADQLSAARGLLRALKSDTLSLDGDQAKETADALMSLIWATKGMFSDVSNFSRRTKVAEIEAGGDIGPDLAWKTAAQQSTHDPMVIAMRQAVKDVVETMAALNTPRAQGFLISELDAGDGAALELLKGDLGLQVLDRWTSEIGANLQTTVADLKKPRDERPGNTMHSGGYANLDLGRERVGAQTWRDDYPVHQTPATPVYMLGGPHGDKVAKELVSLIKGGAAAEAELIGLEGEDQLSRKVAQAHGLWIRQIAQSGTNVSADEIAQMQKDLRVDLADEVEPIDGFLGFEQILDALHQAGPYAPGQHDDEPVVDVNAYWAGAASVLDPLLDADLGRGTSRAVIDATIGVVGFGRKEEIDDVTQSKLNALAEKLMAGGPEASAVTKAAPLAIGFAAARLVQLGTPGALERTVSNLGDANADIRRAALDSMANEGMAQVQANAKAIARMCDDPESDWLRLIAACTLLQHAEPGAHTDKAEATLQALLAPGGQFRYFVNDEVQVINKSDQQISAVRDAIEKLGAKGSHLL